MNPSPYKKKKQASLALANIIEYESKPLAQRFPIDNTYELIQKTKIPFGKDIAIAQLYKAEKNETAKSLTFDQLTQKITQISNLLNKLEVKRSDVVTILLPSLIENQIALWGSQTVCIANPVNHFLDPALIVEIMNEVKSKVLVTLTPGDELGLGAKVADIIKQVPSLTHVLLAADTADGRIDTRALIRSDGQPVGVHVLDFNQAINEQPGDTLVKENSTAGTDTAIYFHTGGTTGKPKIAMLTHASVTFVAQVYADYNHHHGRAAALNPLPLFHVFGTIAASLAIFIQGRCVVMMTPTGFRNPQVVKNWWHFIEKFKVAWFATVPTILSALLKVPFENNTIDCLKFINSGSAPLSVELKKACAKKFNADVVSGYGMTESSCLIARCLNDYERPEDTVGMRIPYTQVITAQLKENTILNVCEPGDPGVVLVKGPNIFQGYMDKSENTKAWVDNEWFNTGDIGVLDDDGYLRLTGRAKDLIIRGGHNIDPQLIETPLEGHPDIAQAVAVGQPDAYAGEIPVVYVCLKSGHSISNEELLDYCRKSISERSAVPKRIEIIEAMPLTAVGKISKPDLRNLATEYAVRHVLEEAGIQASLFAENNPKKGQTIHIDVSSQVIKNKANALLTGFPVIVEFNIVNE